MRIRAKYSMVVYIVAFKFSSFSDTLCLNYNSEGSKHSLELTT